MSQEITFLHEFFERSAALNKNSPCIRTSSRTFSYTELYSLSVQFRDVLVSNSILKKNRVVIYSKKNAESVALMTACSMCELTYVPVSSLNPFERAAHIMRDTSAEIVACDSKINKEFENSGIQSAFLRQVGDLYLYRIFNISQELSVSDNSDAFILFTSGSTGLPKGVVISHAAAAAFINWSADRFEINEQDIISSIAPFNFDLSVFDIYATFSKGATMRLYTEEEAKNALLMAKFISEDKITVIYSTPTFYSVLAAYGRMQKYNYDGLRTVLFAGEVFHPDNLRKLLGFWPEKKYYNLYGPTETNVCTYFEVNTDELNNAPIPIGYACDFAQIALIDNEDNLILEPDISGELIVAGRSLFSRYWNDPVKTSYSEYFINGTRYYRTGDLVSRDGQGRFYYLSRTDRMIKKNGYRIEPGEIENVLVSIRHIVNSTVLFSSSNNLLIAFVESSEKGEIQSDDLKTECQKHLPMYMVPDKIVILNPMPKTVSGKVDIQKLMKLL